MIYQAHQHRGFTLIEMIVITVVVSIVAVAMMGVYMRSVSSSAESIIQIQAVAIAQGYLEEAVLQAYADPDGGETGSCEEGVRQNYDDVQDYNCINDIAGARDQFGGALPGLSEYNISVSVSGVVLGSGNNAAAQQVTVTVTHDQLPQSITLMGYRANY